MKAFARLLVTLLLVLPVALAARAQSAAGQPRSPQPPQPPHVPTAQQSVAVAQLERLLKAVTTGDDDTSFNAVREIYSSPALSRAEWPRQRAFLRRLQFHGVERATATDAEITAYDPAADGWAHLVASVDPRRPHRITSMVVVLGARPRDVPAPPKLQPDALAAATRAELAASVHADRFSGAVLIAHRGQPILTEAYGPADLDARTPNQIGTQFRFGSMGKLFTAVAILQLAQAGKINLFAPVGTYLKDYPNREIATGVTINHLLTHTGGTGDIFGPDFTANRQSLKDLKDYIALYGQRAPRFQPGTRREYSNYGFILLGRIVELTSGLSYDDYLKRHIFTPAGMTSTGNLPESVSLPRRAVGYMQTGPDELQSAQDTLPYRGTSAGGGYSTVDDLLNFSKALLANRLLNATYTKLLEKGGIIGPDGKLIPYDFAQKTAEGRLYYGHSGGAPGMNGELRIFPDDGYVVVVLANLDPPAATTVANFISDRLP